jgi:hypothetical protein
MLLSKSLITASTLSIIILIFNLLSYALNPIYFGEYLVGWDELTWQKGSIHFFENGLGFESIKFSLSIDGSFNNLGWSYLLGLVHNIIGLNYLNVVLLKCFLYFLAVKFLFDILKKMLFFDGEIFIAILFITIYHPMFVIRLTYLRDDIIVYLIIILLGLSNNLKSNFKSFIKLILIIFFSFILFFSRPFAYLVFLVLNIFYFKFFKIKNIFIYLLPFFYFASFFFDYLSYITNFVKKFNFVFSKILFDTVKYYFGPLPWKMIGIDSGYNPLWYVMTLFFILFFSLFTYFYKILLINKKVLISLYFVAFVPYYISSISVDAIGPRQFGMIGPFMFIIIYLPLFSKLFGLKRSLKSKI